MSIQRPVDFSEQIEHFREADHGEDVRGDLIAIAQTLEDAINEQMIDVDQELLQPGQGADAAITGEEIGNLTDGLDTICLKDVVNTNTWTVGSLTAASASNLSATNRLRTNNYVSIADGVYMIKANSGYNFLVYAYSSNGTYIGCMKDLKVFDTNESGYKWMNSYALYEHPEYKYKVVLRKEDNTDMQVSDAANCLYAIKRTDNAFINMGTLSSGAISDITDKNSAYALISSNTYSDYPADETVKNAFVFTTNVVTMWFQILITYTTTTTGTPGMGNVWVRTGKDRVYNDWIKKSFDQSELSKYFTMGRIVGTEETPVSIFNGIGDDKLCFSTYALPSQITEVIPNVEEAFTYLVFGNDVNRAYFGIDRAELKAFVGNRSVSSDVVKTATVKLTSFDRRLAMFGDSITWGRDNEKSGVAQTDHTFNKTIRRNLGIRAFNFGVGSQGWIVDDDTHPRIAYEEVHAHGDTLYNYTDFTLAWGVNDYTTVRANNWAKLGTYDTTDETTMIGQMYKTVNYIYSRVTNANVIIIPPWNGTSFGSFPKYKYTDTGYSPMIEEMEKFCRYYGLPFIDMKDSPLNGWTLRSWFGDDTNPFDLRDGVHPNTDGYKILGSWLAGEIGKIIG